MKTSLLLTAFLLSRLVHPGVYGKAAHSLSCAWQSQPLSAEIWRQPVGRPGTAVEAPVSIFPERKQIKPRSKDRKVGKDNSKGSLPESTGKTTGEKISLWYCASGSDIF